MKKQKSTQNQLSPISSGIGEHDQPGDILPESEEYYSTLIENLADAVFVSRGVITWCNTRVEDLLGYTREELIGKDASFFFKKKNDSSELEQNVYRVTEEHGIYRGTATAKKKDGSIIDVEFSTSRIPGKEPPQFITVARDITILKQLVQKRTQTAAEAVIDAMGDGLILIDTDGTITSVNPAFEKLTGYKKAELVGKNGPDLVKIMVKPSDFKKATEVLRNIGKGRVPAPLVLAVITRDGREIPTALTASIVRNTQGEPTASIFVVKDITDLTNTEKALRQSEQYYRSLIENSLDAVVIMNKDGSIRYESPTFGRILGYSPEHESGKNPFVNVHPEDLQTATDAFTRLLRNKGETLRTEIRARHKDGSWRAIEVVGRNLLDDSAVEGVVANFREVTERRQAEEALVKSEKYFRALIENSLDVVIIMNEEGAIRYQSPSMERVLGYTVEDRIGKRSLSLIHSDDIERVTGDFAKLMEDPASTIHAEVRGLHKDGSWHVIEAIGRNLLDDPTVSGIVVNFRDITERKIAEEELLLKENALENSINAVAMSDMEGNITYLNKACMKMWGNDNKKDIIGKPYWILLNTSDVSIVTEIATAMVEKGYWEGELAATNKDGKEMYVQVAAGLVRNDQGSPIQTISSFIDVTERKKAEEALRESEEKFRRFLEKMNDGYCVLQGYTVVFANARAAEMFGYSQEEVVRKKVQELLPPESVKELANVYEKRKRGERVPTQYETMLTRKDGKTITVEFGARIIDYAGKPAVSIVIRDISERKQMEKALWDSVEEFRTIFEEAAIGMALLDTEGKPIEINPALRKLFGYSSEEFKKMSPLEYIHPDDVTVDAMSFKELVTGKREQYKTEKRYVRKDGRVIWGYQNLSVVRGAEGELRYIIAMIEDITERKRAEDEKQGMEQQLQLTGRLAAVGELAAGVAHELNNPLAAVQAFAQLLASREDLEQSVKSDVGTIYKEAQRASRITTNLLSFARRHKPEKSLISMNEVIEKSLELNAYRMNVNNIEILTELDPDLPRTMADFYQMQQVFVNLITNAEQAMTEAHGQGKFSVTTQKVDEMIRITFADDGPGISKDNLTRIFDPFFTTKDVGKGTGLGLSICFGIIQDHGGHLHAESKPDKGTAFVIEIPVVSEDQHNNKHADSAQPERS